VGDLPKPYCFFLGHPDFGVRAWVMPTGSSGGAVGAWRRQVLTDSDSAYSERSPRMTNATDHRSRGCIHQAMPLAQNARMPHD
jgi:hypothetical protein